MTRTTLESPPATWTSATLLAWAATCASLLAAMLSWRGPALAETLPAPPPTALVESVVAPACGTTPPEPVLVAIPSAPFRPFFKGTAATMVVSAFRMAVGPVTRAEFLDFVKCHPEWRGSRARASLSEPAYLHDFADDLHAGALPAEQPITYVSWFAARAFCESRGLRLPRIIEWERALGSAQPAALASDAAPAFDFAMGVASPALAGSGLMAGRVWEWTFDFNSAEEASGGGPSRFCGDGVRSNTPTDYAAFLRYSFRSSLKASYALKNLGFRCAKGGAP